MLLSAGVILKRSVRRPASAVKREIDARAVDGVYRPRRARRVWTESRSRPKASKLAADGPLRRYVEDKLRERWSPEQISHAVVIDFADDESMRVSAETIYQAIYVQARGGLRREIAVALRSGRTRRKPRRSPEQRTRRFVDAMVMISERPAQVEDRAVPGHWEGDLIVGPAEEVPDVLVPLIETLPEHLRGSLTWDQGCEVRVGQGLGDRLHLFGLRDAGQRIGGLDRVTDMHILD